MRTKFFIAFLFIYCISFAQQSLTTVQINRLADAGKVYGYVKYFHPWLQYKDINWDSAFAASVEGIVNAKNRNDYAIAIQKLFSSLNDGLTQVVNLNGDKKDYIEQPVIHYIKDSLLYIHMNDAPYLTTDDKLSKALQSLNNVNGVIIDMRRPANSRYYDMLGHGVYFEWHTSFFKGDYKMPSMRTVSYSAFPSEWGNGYNNVIFKETASTTISGYVQKEVPLVFIVRKEDEIPLPVIKLQEKGKARILQEEAGELIPGSSLYFYISDNLLIQMRTGEAINNDGSLLTVKADASFSQNDETDVVLSKAKELLTNGRSNLPEQKWEHPMPADLTSPYLKGSAFPAAGYRMLAAAKMYTIIQHFYASKNGMIKNWETAYLEAIPKFIGAKDSLEYWKTVAEFHAFTQDSHGFIAKSNEGFSLRLNPLIQDRGAYLPPVFTGIIENKIVITGIYNDTLCNRVGIRKGDVVLTIDGEDPMKMIEKVRRYQNAGNTGSQNFYLGSFILFGNKGQVKKLKIQNSKGVIKEVMMPTTDEFKGYWLTDKYVSGMFSHNHQPVVKYMSGDIIYTDMTSGLKNFHIDSIKNWLKNAKGLIVDMRGYPQGVALPIESMFADSIHQTKPEISYKLTANLPASAPNVVSVNRFGASLPAEQFQIEYRTKDKMVNLPIKFVVLTNGTAQSSGDYFSFIFKTVYNATVVGSPTAGAMSNFTNYDIPGYIRLWLSWNAIERSGIQPNIYIQPTIKGIQSGKDEVLDRALIYLKSGK